MDDDDQSCPSCVSYSVGGIRHTQQYLHPPKKTRYDFKHTHVTTRRSHSHPHVGRSGSDLLTFLGRRAWRGGDRVETGLCLLEVCKAAEWRTWGW